jgi:hypothetical protein
VFYTAIFIIRLKHTADKNKLSVLDRQIRRFSEIIKRKKLRVFIFELIKSRHNFILESFAENDDVVPIAFLHHWPGGACLVCTLIPRRCCIASFRTLTFCPEESYRMSQPAQIPASAPVPVPAANKGFFQIVGDKTNGFVVLDTAAGTVRKFDLKSNQLSAASLLPTLKQATGAAVAGQAAPPDKSTPDGAGAQGAAPVAPPALQQGIAGNATTGVVYFIGNQMAYLADVGNPRSVWKTLREMPFGPNSDIQGICGDMANGIVVHNGNLLAQAPNVLSYPTWQSNAVSPRLPIKHIGGDCTNGILVYCDASEELSDYEDENKILPSVYRFTGTPYGPATPVPEPTMSIELLLGDGAGGFVAFGENQLYQLDKAKGWIKLATLSFGINAAAGNPKDGLVAIVGADNFIVSSTDFTTWTLKLPATPISAPAPSGPASTPAAPAAPGSGGTAAKGQIVTDGASDVAEAAAAKSAAAPTMTTA